ncbi:L,D-transpeptidase family protein [Acetobacter sacchari]|uniref:L,D-transpeptidase family protein n=1 Tax=Acetobacter sacchari TaxID=2661687 RepID=A0ABS3LYC9_9PROT|nr:L,D-transpeptidase family protein [Acetobacter sacchari]MBO1360917.1 L,D-transpeptidase family protein [Acetobacter sacchari]
MAWTLAACSTMPQHADTELGNRIDAPAGVTVAGEKLDTELLRSFYARHDFEAVWPSHETQANKLVESILHAGDQGLDPELFHASALKHAATLTPTDRDLLLSDAFLSYADALARGVVHVDHRKDYEALAPEPVDVAAELDRVMDSSDPAAAINALAPTTRDYLILRKALQKCRASGARAASTCQHKIAVNLERLRWLPRSLPRNRAWVNVAAEQLILYRNDRPAFTTRIVVGEDIERNQSPEFHTAIDAFWVNPPWVIPADIAKREIMPKISRDPNYLKRNKMVMLSNGEIEQLPGPEAGLGQLMFNMPNRFDVYLHDTPDRYIFNRDNRRLSHGCIRVQNPRDFAALLMEQPVEKIDAEIATGTTTKKSLPEPMPVFVVYLTAFADAAGKLQLVPDFYNRDNAIWRDLQPRPRKRNHTSHGAKV